MRLKRVLLVVCLALPLASCSKGPASIDVSPKKVKIYGLERSSRLTGRLLDKKGQPLEVGPIAWTLAEPDIVSVDATGRLVAKKEGTTTVTATYKKLSVKIPVEVLDVNVLSVSPVQANLIGPVGTRLNLLLTIKNSKNKPIDLRVFWFSSDEKIATVSQDGIVTSVAPGAVTVAARIGDLQAISDLKVELRQIGRLEIKPATAIVRVGDSQHFEIVAYSTDGLPIEGALAFFVSSNPAVATVDGSGQATGLSRGAAVIKAQLGGTEAEATLLVNPSQGSLPR
ncbi:MAG TPA: Ig-like domain-containing protein [Thermoanaerobaculia bacterium]|nr:Ig-like domain-containing protein [Thermoanaerobaculia bacterium]